MDRKEEYFTCECHSADHIVRFMYDDSEKHGDMVFPPDLYVEVQLHQYRGWFKRLWVGIKYIFGYDCRYGHWDVTEFKHEDLPRMRRLFDQYENAYSNYEEELALLKKNI